MSHFFEDVGNFVTAPVRAISGFVSGNPKYNSLGDLYDKSLGPENPISDTFQNEGLKKAARIFSLPSWDALGKPGEAFSNFVDTQNSVLPAEWRPYAQPIESAVLSLFNPLAGAAYQTAYQGGQQQRDNKGFDWGELGKNAAINFGTAGLKIGADKLISGANAANTARAASTNLSPGSLTHAYDSAIPGVSSAYAGSNFAPNAISSASSFAPVSTNVFSSFNPNSSASILASSGTNTIPVTSASQAPAGQGIYKDAVEGIGKNLAPQALSATLAPQGTQPISGALDSFTPNIQTPSFGGANQWGDLLNAFGGAEGNTANPNGPRYDENAINSAVARLGANNYLQQNQARDSALPAGQFRPDQNTPYANRLNEINKGTDQSYQDLRSQIDNANNYYGIIDSNTGIDSNQLNTYLNDPNAIGEVNNSNKYYSILNNNPGLTAEQLDAYLANPTSGVLGNFSVPQESAAEFQGLNKPVLPNEFFKPGEIYTVPPNIEALSGLRPLGPQNMSLL